MESFKLFLLTYGFILTSILYQLCYFLQVIFKNLASLLYDYKRDLDGKCKRMVRRRARNSV